jgi:hypothetical protein
MFRVYAMFSLSVLALIATRDLASLDAMRSRRVRWAMALSAALLALVAVIVFHGILAMVVDPGPQRQFAARVHLWTVWLGVLATGVTGSLLPTRTRAALVPAGLVLLSLVDAVGAHRLPRTLWNLDPAAVENWRRIDAGHDSNLDLTAKGTRRVVAFEDPARQYVTNKNLPSKTAILMGYSPFSNRFHDRWVQQGLLWQAATGEDRFWFAPEVVQVALDDPAFEEFVTRAVSVGAPPLVIHPPAAPAAAAAVSSPTAIRGHPAATRMPVTLKAYRPEQLILEVEAPSDGWVLVTDRWAHGWRATVNGQAVGVTPANFIFRAVPVTKGLNTIDFTYRPYGWPWLVILSWGTATAIGGAAAVVGWRNLARRPALRSDRA